MGLVLSTKKLFLVNREALLEMIRKIKNTQGRCSMVTAVL